MGGASRTHKHVLLLAHKHHFLALRVGVVRAGAPDVDQVIATPLAPSVPLLLSQRNRISWIPAFARDQLLLLLVQQARFDFVHGFLVVDHGSVDGGIQLVPSPACSPLGRSLRAGGWSVSIEHTRSLLLPLLAPLAVQLVSLAGSLGWPTKHSGCCSSVRSTISNFIAALPKQTRC